MSFDDFLFKIKFKFYYKQWTLGFFYGDIREIIRSGVFDPDINWLRPASEDQVSADPFPLKKDNGTWDILFEDLSVNAGYGNISVLTLDKDLRQTGRKTLLDIKSHLSFPFIFSENKKIYIFPEAAHSGKFSCYEYNPDNKTVVFVDEILNFPVYDSTILKYDGIYWLFNTVTENKNYKLNIYFSDSLTGPYSPHSSNPVKTGLNGTRAAGNFIEVDNVIYRPSQNCKTGYGESITINRIRVLNEKEFKEEPYMQISAGKKMLNKGIHTIHTINFSENLIAVDGIKWTFSLKEGYKNLLEMVKK